MPEPPRSPSRTFALPVALRGPLWMLSSAICFSLLSFCIRKSIAEVHPLETVFFRNIVSVLLLMPWLARAGFRGLATERFWHHALRASFGLAAMITWFIAVSLMPLAELTALSFTAPLFAAVGAVIFLGETVHLRRWIAIAAGFAGILIILRPGAGSISAPALLAIVNAVFVASAVLAVKWLSRTESPTVIVLYFNLLVTPISFVVVLFVWTWPSPETLAWLFGVGFFATIGHLSYTRAFAAADTSAVLPYDFSKLLFVALLAYLAFGEVPDAWTWVGAGVIFLANLYIARREMRAGQREAAAARAIPGISS